MTVIPLHVRRYQVLAYKAVDAVVRFGYAEIRDVPEDVAPLVRQAVRQMARRRSVGVRTFHAHAAKCVGVEAKTPTPEAVAYRSGRMRHAAEAIDAAINGRPTPPDPSEHLWRLHL